MKIEFLMVIQNMVSVDVSSVSVGKLLPKVS